MVKDFKCRECENFHGKTQGELIRHLRVIHATEYEAYVLNYFFNNEYPKCKCGCGREMKFNANLDNFFNEYTKNHFPRKPHSEVTREKIKSSYKKTMMEKYGVDNPMHLKEFIAKIGNTKKERYGNSSYNNKEKERQTKLDKYGDSNYNNPKQIIATNQEKYGANSFSATVEGIQQIKQTKLDRYNNPNYNNIEKCISTKQVRYGYSTEFENPEWKRIHNSSTSAIEQHVQQKLSAEPKFLHRGKVYDMILGNTVIEVDGDAFHPERLENLTLTMMNTAINDYIKTQNLQNSEYTLLRIKTSVLKKMTDICIDSVRDNSYVQNFTLDFYQKIMTRESLQRFIDKKGKDKLKTFIKLFYRFIVTFQPHFPEIPTNENLNEVILKIQKYDLSVVMDSDNSFRNTCSNIGSSYLKSKFRSYWKSSFKGQKPPVNAWEDPTIMKKVIEYRIGLNNSNEIFDFSLHQMVRGLSARRFTVSFFKPVLAAAIYQHFLGDNETPIVLDPCAGFGGRMLGFKSRFPNGTYIGVEPNPETFTELVELSKNFTNVILYNCKIEDLDQTLLPETIDLTFTSIPYYDLEIYSNHIEYVNFDVWKDTFLESVINLPNLVLNIPESLRHYIKRPVLEYRIVSSTGHFNRENVEKFEHLLHFKH